jgi:hypothetical protein
MFAPWRLVDGHYHEAANWDSVQIVSLWPSTTPGLWHVGLIATTRRATKKPVTEERVYELLAEWDFQFKTSWSRWRVEAVEGNPAGECSGIR